MICQAKCFWLIFAPNEFKTSLILPSSVWEMKSKIATKNQAMLGMGCDEFIDDAVKS